MQNNIQQVYVIDGKKFSTLEELWDEVENALADFINEVGCFGRNLDAFRDILCVAKTGTVIVWKNSKLSLKRLGYIETSRQLEKRLTQCHPLNIEFVKRDLELSKNNRGEIVFDWLVKIFVEEENIELRLE